MLNILVAYPYLAKKIVVDRFIENQSSINLLIDSGAFTAWKAGTEINIDDYCNFIEKFPFKPWSYFNLDVIGDPIKSMENYQLMRDRGFSPIPIFTRGEKNEVIEEYYKTSEVLAVGGLVGTKGNKGFVKSIMKKINTRKVHWLGFTDKAFIKHYKPFSCDSSSLTMAGRYGNFELFNPYNGKWIKCSKKDFALRPDKKVIGLLDYYGFDYKELAKKENWHGVSISEQISFRSHIKASLTYKQKLNTNYFLALARLPFDINMCIEQYEKLRSLN